ncbi:MAG TPA: zinc ABC transporter substrate-binding protein [Rhabdochlamydiaceae bacterium]|nr:zinc ABC transporter substrate-binding protein [Rhabdochlamydiaceae bacterium]
MIKNLTLKLIIFCFCIGLGLLAGCEKSSNPPKTTVLVSIPPYRYFVERIAGPDLVVQTIVPPGANPHLFEPSPKQAALLSDARLWLSIGESFEKKIKQVLKEQNPRLKIVDMKKGIPLLQSHEETCVHCSKHEEAKDLHIWLSPKLAQTQAKNIAACLIELFPENKEMYEKNVHDFLIDLDKLDHEIGELLEPMKNKAILVSHPAFGYLCNDYHLIQLSVESEGKDPLPQQIAQTLKLAKEFQVKNVLLQPQYNNKGAEMIAEMLKLPVFMLDPYSSDYIVNLRTIAAVIAASQ